MATAMIPRQRGRVEDRTPFRDRAAVRFLSELVVSYLSGAAWCAGFLTTAIVTYLLGTWLVGTG